MRTAPLSRLRWSAIAVVALVWACAITYRLGLWGTGPVDRRWDAFARPAAGAFGQHLSVLLAIVGAGAPALVVAAGVVWLVLRRRGRGWALAAASIVAVSELQVLALKLTAGRPRPDSSLGWHQSFPSGHTANAAVMAVLVSALLLEGRWRLVPALWPVLMAWSRTVLHAHWLSDVVAGAAVGTATAVLGLVIAAAVLRSRRRPPVAPRAHPESEPVAPMLPAP